MPAPAAGKDQGGDQQLVGGAAVYFPISLPIPDTDIDRLTY